MYASDDSELMISVLLSSIALTQFTVAIIDKITKNNNIFLYRMFIFSSIYRNVLIDICLVK